MIQVICIPDDPKRIEQLELKLVEYKRRLADYASRQHRHCLDVICKIFVLERLLQSGAANRNYLRALFLKEHGSIDETSFNNAFGCMEDYCTTGGKNIMGGTGL
ncbi:MAG TPA: hypothetical protein VF817_00675 [Patescibacteria group bacterium]